MGDAGLGQRDDVHVALGQDERSSLARLSLGAVEVVEEVALVEDLGLGRVQVLGPGVAQRPAAEAHGPAALVGNREHQAVAEMGKGLAALVGLDKTGREQLGVAEALPLERLAQPLPLIGRVAQLEGADGRPVDPAPLEIGHRLPAGGARQLGLEPGRRGGVGGVQPLAGLGLRLRLRRAAGRLQAGELGQPVQRVAESSGPRAA